MKNPFPSPVTITDTNRYGDQYIGCPLAAISITVCRGPQDDMNPEEVAEFLVHAINQHEKLVELAQLAYDVIEDDLEERPARHSLDNLSARLRTILKEEKT